MDQSPNCLNPKQEAIAFYLLCLLYLICGATMFHFLKYAQNPDGISYLTIARSYASGNWKDAVNAYWSPLLSWMVAPFSRLPLELLFVFKIINLFFGLLILFIARNIFKLYALLPGWSLLLLSILAILLLRFVFDVNTPDLLSSALLLGFFRYWLSGNILNRYLPTALWMSLLFFAKAYNLYFVLAVLILDVFILLLARKSSVFNAATSMVKIVALYFLVCAPWLIALYLKYGQFILTGSGGFNHGGTMFDNWSYLLDFVAPPYQNSVFAWEDPFLLSGYRDYSILSSWKNFSFQVGIAINNLKQIVIPASSTKAVILGGLILLISGIFLDKGKKGEPIPWRLKPANNEFFRFFIFFSLYAGGYLLMLMEDRYFWGNVILTVVLSGIFIARFIQRPQQLFPQKLSIPVYVIFLLSVCAVLFRYVNHVNFFSEQGPGANKRSVLEYSLGKKLVDLPVEKKRMAKWPPRGDYTMFASWNVAYFAEGKHFFTLPRDIKAAEKLIRDNAISMVFVPSDITIPEDFIISNWKKTYSIIEDTDLYECP